MKWIIPLCLFLCACRSETVYLTGTWKLDSYLENGDALTQNISTYVTYEFTQDDQIIVQLEANSCQGTYERISGHEINIRQMGCTEICCDSTNSIHALNLAVDLVNSYLISDKTLYLQGDNGLRLKFSLVE